MHVLKIRNVLKNINFVSNEFKLNLCIAFCSFVHGSLVFFGYFYDVPPLMIFNVFSVSIYIICFFLVKKYPWFIYFYAYAEIISHSFFSVILIGNRFGFSLYFVLLVPISYNMLHSMRVNYTLTKATIASLFSFVSYALCYFHSIYALPQYQSEALDKVAPYVYLFNIFVTFGTLMTYSILFILESEEAFNKLNDKNKELKTMANTDPLTGLYNRRSMSGQIKKSYEDYKTGNVAFSLIICDIDNFKSFNDTYGHECGDVVLKSITKELSGLVREGDYLCRWGGEEFLILLYGIEVEKAREVAERFRRSIEEMVVSYNELRLHLTMTFGVSGVSEAESYNDLFKIADGRLYDGKNCGKNCVR